MASAYRVGSGWDSHEFQFGRPLWLGGVRIPAEKGLAGHSDGDVLLHAVCDALLGALGLDDIGAHFPSTDPRWRGAASAQFVRQAIQWVRERGWELANLDVTLILVAPPIGPLRSALQASVAGLLGIDSDQVSIKAKTPEGLNWADTAVAHCTVLLHRAEAPDASPGTV